MSDQIDKERHHLTLARISTERLLKTDEVAAPVAWLCSAASSFATGGMRVARRPRHALTRHHACDFCGTQDVAACANDIDGDAGRSEGHVGPIAPELYSRRFQRQARSWRCLTWEHLAAMIARRMSSASGGNVRPTLLSHPLFSTRNAPTRSPLASPNRLGCSRARPLKVLSRFSMPTHLLDSDRDQPS